MIRRILSNTSRFFTDSQEFKNIFSFVGSIFGDFKISFWGFENNFFFFGFFIKKKKMKKIGRVLVGLGLLIGRILLAVD